SPEQQLLPRLATGVKRPRHLSAPKRAIRQQTAILPSERNPLRHTLIDNIDADLGQAINVRLARPKIPAFYGVVKQSVNTVAIVGVVLGRIDAALRGNAMSPSGTILKTQAFHPVAQLRQTRCRRGTG